MSHSDSISENAPLLPEQRAALMQLMQELKPDQLLWLEGYISGLRIGRGDAPVSTSAAVKAPALTILYGSESGNSETLQTEALKLPNKEASSPRLSICPTPHQLS